MVIVKDAVRNPVKTVLFRCPVAESANSLAVSVPRTLTNMARVSREFKN